MALTPKKDKFAQCIVSGMNQSDAYRASYDVGSDTLIDTINNNAYMLMQDSDIIARIAELKKPIEEQVGMSLKSYIEEMRELKNLALSAEEYSASIKAFENVGKVLGYYVNKTELTGRNGAPIEHKITREIIDPVVDGTSEY